jgi:hypothetical protein
MAMAIPKLREGSRFLECCWNGGTSGEGSGLANGNQRSQPSTRRITGLLVPSCRPTLRLPLARRTGNNWVGGIRMSTTARVVTDGAAAACVVRGDGRVRG